MKNAIHLFIIYVLLMLVAGCTGTGKRHMAQLSERLRMGEHIPESARYTIGQVLDVYDYQPVRALQMLDSAVIVGNISPWRASLLRMRVYAWTQMGPEVDSLLHGPIGVRYDSARVIGERMLAHDSVRTSLGEQQNALELLVYTARQQQDTARLLRWSQQLVGVCRAQGAETEALRTEAEVGAVLCMMGQREQGMAKMDSVIACLTPEGSLGFNELDATIIALKRKLVVLSSEGKYAEVLPLAYRIIELLDDYERHPDDYHDDSYREPTDSTARADYIHFYRTQAQSAVTVAYAFLGEQGSMNDAYAQIERSVREATAREHKARYNALDEQMRRQQAEMHSRLLVFVSTILASGLLLLMLFSAYFYFQKRKIQQKNRALMKLMHSQAATPAPAEHSPGAGEETAPQASSAQAEDGDRRLFLSIDSAIRSERLYTNPDLQRQDVCDRFGLRRDVLNRLLADHADSASFPVYINGIRLSEASRLLKDDPSRTVNAIADEVGLSPRNLRRLFVDHYGMTPTEYRRGLEENR